MLKLVIAGGTGRLGELLLDHYRETDALLTVLTRGPASHTGRISYVSWDGVNPGTWVSVLEDADVLINLSGKSVESRFTSQQKKELLESRVRPTQALAMAVQQCRNPPKLWINAGGISIYEPSGELRTEQDQPIVRGFLANVSRQWEAAFYQTDTPGTRKVLIRIAPVLQRGQGMLPPLVMLARFGFGGRLGSGQQYISWIHQSDLVNLISWIVAQQKVAGVIHASSPYPIPNRDFMKAIRHVLGIRVGFPNPAWMVKLGSWLMGKEASLVLTGNRVVSATLEEQGFSFAYPGIEEALDHLLKPSTK